MWLIVARVCFVSAILGLTTISAAASPSCMKDQKPYQLAFDTIQWSMSIQQGDDCIQGLRWSFMQIYSVSVTDQPKGGEVVIVGSGFRYFARPNFTGIDKFRLVVIGKNRHDAGVSTIDITVFHPNDLGDALTVETQPPQASPKRQDVEVSAAPS
jgi:hypothetical protein